EYGLAVLADSTITYFIWLPLLLASKKWAAPFARFTGVDSKRMSALEKAAETNSTKPIPPNISDYILLFGVSLVATWIASLAATWLENQASHWVGHSVAASPFLSAKTWQILLITTIGLALSATPLGQLPGSHELAM